MIPSSTTTDDLRSDPDAFRLNALIHFHQMERRAAVPVEQRVENMDRFQKWLSAEDFRK